MKSEKGFTLVEMLVSFTLFLLIVSFFPIIIPLAKQTYNPDFSMNEMEWEIFVNQLAMEYREAKEVRIHATTLTLKMENNQVITYERYEDKIRRRVDESGHEVVLQHIKNIMYEQQKERLLIRLTDGVNKGREETITTFLMLAYET
ncbi:competence type IV pilus minor pilin ComGF [Priestia megaterium]|uniref:competence type IV pilus minor pilin ComGF n=1 Tax=Priestia megaterium TaxID=1404 RepID=UPI000344CF3B|nr:competence type IV pilus minor pilin ComGF [Priestia megaterium]AYE49230.1 competence protein ComG [Priestia megaterium NCT-2]KLV30328.1 competence protein ComG [Priestia megaterium]MCE4091081.1 prepilin-type N-terminal cleavage/methylation domain-containing protein [Priestia megaterium]MCR8928377.1 prepilin-type N-terminal cleavage/methylation domain-containing protein [Priestia megaterium]MDH3157929.1 competence type IV pilus minor pilin ComGF [Priestia megaterium]